MSPILQIRLPTSSTQKSRSNKGTATRRSDDGYFIQVWRSSCYLKQGKATIKHNVLVFLSPSPHSEKWNTSKLPEAKRLQRNRTMDGHIRSSSEHRLAGSFGSKIWSEESWRMIGEHQAGQDYTLLVENVARGDVNMPKLLYLGAIELCWGMRRWIWLEVLPEQ